MESEKWKLPVVICITVTYTLSFVLINVGYFTPAWVTGLDGIFPWWELKCTSAGLVSGWCRFDLTDAGTDVGNYEYLMRSVFYLETSSIICQFAITVMLAVAIGCHLLDDQIYRAFLSIMYGVIYPISGVLCLVGCILTEANFGPHTGYSCIISTIAGGLSIIFYVFLRLYDHYYLSSRRVKR